MTKKTFAYTAVRATQGKGSSVFSLAAAGEEVLAFADIDRVGRDSQGKLHGFQRHQIAPHIKEIRDYLAREDAILPNPIVVAFIKGKGVKVRSAGEGLARIEIDVSKGKPGFVVDGQQRLTALSGLPSSRFQVFVSVLICKDYNELRQQFVLINNTRPLPKALIYELLPTVEGLPERFTARSFAARLVDALNYDESSSLHGLIHQHTNPKGVISDTALQKVIMNSASDGAVRELVNEQDFIAESFKLFSNFFGAVRETFSSEWEGMTPKTSRLVHGAGIVSMGYVMELLYSRIGARTGGEFKAGLRLLEGKTAWTSGEWRLSDSDVRPWNGIQNTPSDIDVLTNYLVRELKREIRSQNRAAA